MSDFLETLRGLKLDFGQSPSAPSSLPPIEKLLSKPFRDVTPERFKGPRPDLLMRDGANVLTFYVKEDAGLYVLIQVIRDDCVQLREIHLGYPPLSAYNN